MQIRMQTREKICVQTLPFRGLGRVTYTLMEDRFPSGRYGERISYAISVELRGDRVYDEKTVQDLTGDKGLAVRLFWMVCRGMVTPCTLTEVLSDLLP